MTVGASSECLWHLTALLKRHGSLGLLGLSSASYFFAMIVARKTLEPDDLYFWNALVTLVAMGFSLCFLGAEQLFLRFSTVSETGEVRINRTTLHVMGGALVVFTAVLATLSEAYFFQLGSISIYPALGLCVGIFVFVYNLLRVRKSFSTAQLAANGWKFTILIGVLLAPLGNAPWIIMAGLGVACLGVLWLFVRNRRALEVSGDPMPNQWQKLLLAFFLSLFVLMLLNNADRLIMLRNGSEALFSEYVYLVTLLLLPFSLLSNYFGFKEMAYLKYTYDRRRFLRKTLGVGGLAAGLFIPWFGLIYAAQTFLEVPVQIDYAIPCCVIVTCRCAYPLLSALFSLQAKLGQFYAANLLTLLAIGLAMAVLLSQDVATTSVLILLAAFWCTRLGIYAWYTSQIAGY